MNEDEITPEEVQEFLAERSRCDCDGCAEYDQLRALITAWADADDALAALIGTDASFDTIRWTEIESDAALDALRKAVRR